MRRQILILLLLPSILVAALGGCSFLNSVGGYVNEHQLVIDIAVRRAIFRYVDAGENEAERHRRAAAVVDVVRKVDRYLQGDPATGVDMLLLAVENEIRWEGLSLEDAATLREVVALIRANIQNQQTEGLLGGDTLVGLRSLLRTASNMAALL